MTHIDTLAMLASLSADIGPAIREARECVGWSQAQLAYALRIPPQNVSRWESGRQYPRPATLAAIVAALRGAKGE